MKWIYFLVLFTSLLSCRKEAKKHNYNLIGKWKRTEVYINPGNGGKWQKDNSILPVTIELSADGKFDSNANFYSSFKNYEVNGNNSIEFHPAENGVTRAVFYSFNSDSELTLTMACIEGCGEKFVKY